MQSMGAGMKSNHSPALSRLRVSRDTSGITGQRCTHACIGS